MGMTAAVAAAVLGLTGCTNNSFTRLGFPNPITEQGKTVLTLWQGSWIAGLAVGVLVWGLILWAVIFHRKRGNTLPPQARYNMPIEIMYTAVPFVLIAIFFYYTAKDENYIDKISPHPQRDRERPRASSGAGSSTTRSTTSRISATCTARARCRCWRSRPGRRSSST